MPFLRPVLVASALALLAAGGDALAKKTVCTITVNSADEKDTLRARLPKGEYEFVELVEKGRPDWLRSSCQKQVQCDVLVVSGHFNAGDTFYSDRLDREEYLAVDELERASCSASCPNLFSHLKEVYLFGCESLNPDATKYQSSYGESGRDRMRRLFPNVPSIYGFYSSAPVGPTAAMLLNRYFDGGGAREWGTGRTNERLLKIFGRNHMTRVSGVRDGEPMAAYRRQVCEFFDDDPPAKKLAFVRSLLRGGGDVRGFFPRIEKLIASMDESQRSAPEFTAELARLSADDVARDRYLAVLRAQPPAGERSRMIALAGTFGWLSPDALRAEQVAMLNELLARPTLAFTDVDLACSLNADRHLDGAVAALRVPSANATRVAHAAALACLGSRDAHAQVVRALASRDDGDVQVAQVYLRYRPIDAHELRPLARDVARMQGPAQVRALDAIARLNISDREILQELSRAYAQAKSAAVQRAIAEVFIRSDPKALPRHDLANILREHRIRAPGAGPDLVDTLLSRLQG